jgi:predicted phage terminase large subunit-like protein
MDLPMRFSRWVREIVRDKAYQALFENCVIDPESQSAEAWNTLMGGGFTAAGVGGGITGKGAHVLIVDDPIKNQEEADSITTRDGLWSWYWSTAYTRLAPGGGVLVIQTWWNDDDLAGRLQSRMHSDEGKADAFDVVKYPALAETYEYLNEETNKIERFEEPINTEELKLKLLRKPGEALHPERYNESMLVNYRENMPRRTWSALYQQNPVPDEGMFFQKDWFKFEAVYPGLYNRNVYQAWDFAIGEKQHNDYTVGVTLIQDEHDNLHVVDMRRFKGDTFVIIEQILDMALEWGVEPTCPLLIGFEDGQVWKAIKPLLLSRMAERKQYPNYVELKTLTDKMARASKLQGRLQHGRVWLPQEKPWVNTLMTELLRFPAGAHDDIVDALAHGVNLVVGRVPKPIRRTPNRLKTWRDKLLTIGGGDGGHMGA